MTVALQRKRRPPTVDVRLKHGHIVAVGIADDFLDGKPSAGIACTPARPNGKRIGSRMAQPLWNGPFMQTDSPQ
jgi:hypothetical protein